MKFITVEQFLKADVKVQNAILKWWKPSVGDLVSTKDNNKYCVIDNFVEAINCCSLNLYNSINCTVTKNEVVPLLTEGQLIELIENKLGGRINIGYLPMGYDIKMWDDDFSRVLLYFSELGHDLLQALWQVAIKIIKGDVKNEEM